MGSSRPPTGRLLQPGDTLDRYELLCVLAQGGMGTVWLARVSGGAEELFAVKTILPAHSEADVFRNMFLDEANIASRVRHENVARLVEGGDSKGILYFAMEFIEGDSLRKLQRDRQKGRRGLPLAPLLHVFREACRGLHAVHELRDERGERQRRRAPRRVPAERARRRRRHGQDHRLRRRQGPRSPLQGDDDRHPQGQARLHAAGAGAGLRSRPARRRLRAGRRPLRRGDGAPAARLGAARARAGAARSGLRRRPRAPRSQGASPDRRGHRAGAGAQARGPLRELRRARAGALPRDGRLRPRELARGRGA